MSAFNNPLGNAAAKLLRRFERKLESVKRVHPPTPLWVVPKASVALLGTAFLRRIPTLAETRAGILVVTITARASNPNTATGGGGTTNPSNWQTVGGELYPEPEPTELREYPWRGQLQSELAAVHAAWGQPQPRCVQ
jgi:hypothetical protein